MADRGIDFTPDLGDSGQMPKDIPTGSLSEGGPIKGGPDTNRGASTGSTDISNGMGTPSTGGEGTIKFVGG